MAQPLIAARARLAALLLGALALCGCNVTGLLAAATPGPSRVSRDIAYGQGPRRTLDVYRPAGEGPAPVVVFFYGGSWQDGDKAIYGFVGKALASKGFVTVIPNYRVHPEVIYPEFLRDGAAAVRWTRDNTARHGGDPGRLYLMGHSAGAYNAAMLTLDERWLAEAGMDARREVRATVGISGPYDFLPLTRPDMKIIFGPEADRPLTQPIRYVDGLEAPMLLLHGGADSTVEPSNATRLAARIRAKGGRVQVKTYPGLDHIRPIAAVSGPLRFLAPVLNDAVAFLRSIDAQPSPAPKP